MKNILEFIKQYTLKKNKIICKTKNKNINIHIKTNDSINDYSKSLKNNSKNSIRRKYKQKSKQKDDNYSTNAKSIDEVLDNYDEIKDGYTFENEFFDEIKKLFISEDNWNINQIGELYKFQERLLEL